MAAGCSNTSRPVDIRDIAEAEKPSRYYSAYPSVQSPIAGCLTVCESPACCRRGTRRAAGVEQDNATLPQPTASHGNCLTTRRLPLRIPPLACPRCSCSIPGFPGSCREAHRTRSGIPKGAVLGAGLFRSLTIKLHHCLYAHCST